MTTLNPSTSYTNRRGGSIFGQFWMVLLQPSTFFKNLASASQSTQWIWMALLILLLTGYSAVRQDSVNDDSGASTDIPTDIPIGEVPFEGGEVFGGPPPDVQPGTTTTSEPKDITGSWSTALLAASTIVLGWGGLSLLLSEISLLRGEKPSLSKNLQLAVWATVPLGVMAGLQILYFTMGGTVGHDGLSGLLLEWQAYPDLSEFKRNVIFSLASSFTIFWLWSLALLYNGGRFMLNGKRWSAALVVLAWIMFATITPVLIGTVSADDLLDEAQVTEEPIDNLDGSENFFPDGSEIPSGAPSEGFPSEEGVPSGGKPGRPKG